MCHQCATVSGTEEEYGGCYKKECEMSEKTLLNLCS